MSVLSVLRHLNYSPWFALAEFVDNSLQSYIETKSRIHAIHGSAWKLKVSIDIDTSDPGRITIRDNAAGIAADAFPRAFRPAVIPPDRTGLSEFGMGMKSAACWFASKWQVRTKALGEAVERTVRFDIAAIVRDELEELFPAFSRENRPEPSVPVGCSGIGGPSCAVAIALAVVVMIVPVEVDVAIGHCDLHPRVTVRCGGGRRKRRRHIGAVRSDYAEPHEIEKAEVRDVVGEEIALVKSAGRFSPLGPEGIHMSLARSLGSS